MTTAIASITRQKERRQCRAWITGINAPLFFSAAAGVLWCLVFLFPEAGILSLVSFVPLLFAVQQSGRPSSAFSVSYVFGLLFFCPVFFWISNVSAILFVAACMLSALFAGAFGLALYAFRRVFPHGFIYAAPPVWTALEYARGAGFWGFPVGLAGYGLGAYDNLLQAAELGGIWAVSFLVMTANVLAYRTLIFRTVPARILHLALLITLLLSWDLSGGRRSSLMRSAVTGRVRVAVIQPNIFPRDKWRPEFLERTLDICEELSREAARRSPDLIIWPETAIPCFLFHPRRSACLARLKKFSRRIRVPLLIGTQDFAVRDRKYVYNCLVMIDNGAVCARYDKTRLIPLIENAPLKRLIPLLRRHRLGAVYDPGEHRDTFEVNGRRFGAFICFEGIFPGVAARLGEGADFLVNVTNDFPSLGGLPRYYEAHFQMLRVRAIESRLPIVRCSNNGVSGVIDRDSRVLERFPSNVRSFFIADVPIYGRRTAAGRPIPASFYGK